VFSISLYLAGRLVHHPKGRSTVVLEGQAAKITILKRLPIAFGAILYTNVYKALFADRRSGFVIVRSNCKRIQGWLT
jgi:hypothetical protein